MVYRRFDSRTESPFRPNANKISIPAGEVTVGTRIGTGGFAVVYDGTLLTREGRKVIVVKKERGTLVEQLYSSEKSSALVDTIAATEPLEVVRGEIAHIAQGIIVVAKRAEELGISTAHSLDELKGRLVTLSEDPQVTKLNHDARARDEVFHQESIVLGLLRGLPFIPEFFGEGLDDDGHSFLVIEKAVGSSLKGIQITPSNFADLMGQTVNALGGAHARGIVHRDLSPDSIFATQNRQTGQWELEKIIDWNIAAGQPETGIKAVEDIFNDPVRVFGKPPYTLNQRITPLDSPQRDIYALGVIMNRYFKQIHPLQLPAQARIIANMISIRSTGKGIPWQLTPFEADLLQQGVNLARQQLGSEFDYASAETMAHDVRILADALRATSIRRY